jgi:hypothetical protein
MKIGDTQKERTLTPADYLAELFDPFLHFQERERQLAKLDIGWAKAALGFRTGNRRYGHGNSRKGLTLLTVFERLEAWRERFELGDTMALLHGVRDCADENVPLPTWLAVAFQDALQRFAALDGPTSLDKIFLNPLTPTSTPKKAAAAKQYDQLACLLWDEARHIVHTDESITSIDALVDVVLSKKDYGVKKTKARELILKMENSQLQLRRDRPSKHLSRILEKRRKR